MRINRAAPAREVSRSSVRPGICAAAQKKNMTQALWEEMDPPVRITYRDQYRDDMRAEKTNDLRRRLRRRYTALPASVT